MKRNVLILFLVFLLAIEVVYGVGGEFGVMVSVTEREEDVTPPGPSPGGGGVSVPKEEVVEKVPVRAEDIIVEPSIIRVSIKLGDVVEKSISVSNIGSKTLDISVEVQGLDDVVKLEESSFSLKASEKNIVNVVFDSRGEGLEAGVYNGKVIFSVDGIKKDVLIIVEVETRRIIFDVKGYIPTNYKKVRPGGEVLNNIDLYNMEGVDEADVHFTYQIRDFNGNVIVSEEEIITIGSDISFTKRLRLPQDVEPGEYVFVVIAKYETSVATATDVFEVVEELLAPPVRIPIWAFVIVILMVMAIIFGVLVRHQIRIKQLSKKIPKKVFIKRLKEVHGRYKRRRILEEERVKKRADLRRKLMALEQGYKSGYISENVYNKTRRGIEDILRGSRKKAK